MLIYGKTIQIIGWLEEVRHEHVHNTRKLRIDRFHDRRYAIDRTSSFTFKIY